ncbi:MAG: ATP-binding protein [Oceanipulchritudo sp.]
MQIERRALRGRVEGALGRSRVVSLLGPRQAGKTTLARTFVGSGSVNYFDLEDPRSSGRLDQPMLALEGLEGLVVIDEIQLRPELFGVLRVLADREDRRATFLILGSASPDLVERTAQSLAGRVETIEVTPFSSLETGLDKTRRHWLRGGYPLSYLAGSEADSVAWREGFIGQFLQKDIPQFGITISPTNLRRFWSMLAHYHGQVWNASEIGGSIGVSGHTTCHYLDILSETFMVRQLPAWHENLKKRQVKAPKIYLRDSGIFHSLVGIPDWQALQLHPKLGASWEGYAVEEILRSLRPREAYFWAVHNGPELDLLCFKEDRRIGFEVKYADAPKLTRSMTSAAELLRLDALKVVYPGNQRYLLSERIEAVPLSNLLAEGL